VQIHVVDAALRPFLTGLEYNRDRARARAAPFRIAAAANSSGVDGPSTSVRHRASGSPSSAAARWRRSPRSGAPLLRGTTALPVVRVSAPMSWPV
jgi:hypothetical protein